MSRVEISTLNRLDRADAVELVGGAFEHSPWITKQALDSRPFASLSAFHAHCMEIIREAGDEAVLALIRAHPDLVGRLAREGQLGAESTVEQKAAGLTSLTSSEVDLFESYNQKYRTLFGFPFVICARENRKEAILGAFPVRLQNSRDVEMQAALEEIGKIAWLRLADRIDPDSYAKER